MISFTRQVTLTWSENFYCLINAQASEAVRSVAAQSTLPQKIQMAISTSSCQARRNPVAHLFMRQHLSLSLKSQPGSEKQNYLIFSHKLEMSEPQRGRLENRLSKTANKTSFLKQEAFGT